MDKIRIILIEDELDTCDNFQRISKNYNEIEIISITNSSIDAIDAINRLKPDAIILDLELHNGEGSGLDVLKSVKNGDIHPKPFILITTNNPSEATLKLTQQYGADFTCKKYQLGYSESVALDNIILFKELILRNKNKDALALSKNELLAITYKQRIFDELSIFGISYKNISHKYFLDAILFVINDPNAKYINLLSKKYNKTPDSIKKAMQRSINYAWDHNDPEVLSKCYISTIDLLSGSPTIKSFVKYYAEKVQL